jgi:cytochrome c oxidase cbb3-type subunit I/II
MAVQRKLGVPYSDEDVANAVDDYRAQAREISDYLREKDVELAPDSELTAMIAYLQRLGKTKRTWPPAETAPVTAEAVR